MATIGKIMQGWKNYMDKSEVVEDIARERAAICAECPKAKHGKLLTFIKDNLKEIEGYYCGVCSCPLSAKVRSNDICPMSKWK